MFYERWMDLSNCIGTDPEAFFVYLNVESTGDERRRFEVAKRICEECPVKKRCLEFAEKEGFVGMFGGVYKKPAV